MHFESEPDIKVVDFAADGLEAIQKAEELQPDLILMDVSLPGMSGMAATRQIRTLAPLTKILFMSEHSDPYIVQHAFNVGGSGYILKSDAYSDLIPGIRTVFLGHQFVSKSLKDWRESSNPTE